MQRRGNPRRANSTKRNRIKQLLKDRGDPCHICGKDIDYSLPPGDPFCFEIDEIVPVSRYWEGGYKSPEDCALDPRNCRAAHRCCNQKRGNKRLEDLSPTDTLTLPLSQSW